MPIFRLICGWYTLLAPVTLTHCRRQSVSYSIKNLFGQPKMSVQAAKRLSKSSIDWVRALEKAAAADKNALKVFKARQDAYISR